MAVRVMNAIARGARQAWRWTALIAALAGFLVWNAVFDLWLGQGERQYLWEAAKHDMGRGPAVSLAGSMEASIRDGAIVATLWAAVVVLAVVAAAYVWFRLACHVDLRAPIEPDRK
jgi:hypothetical protein